MPSAMSSEPLVDADVVIVANFVSPHLPGNNRFHDLARRLTRLGANVELVTSDFSHKSSSRISDLDITTDYKVTLVYEPGYAKNVSVRRLLSQHVFSKNVGKYLESRLSKPDIIYCATPPPEAARVCARFATTNNIPFIVDIQDLWPEAFSMAVGFPRLVDLLFTPMVHANRAAYNQASAVVGVSQTYIDHAEKIAQKKLPASVVYLGTTVDSGLLKSSPREPTDTARNSPGFRIAYAGTLSHSYDIPTVIDAVASLTSKDESYRDIELVVLGDGPKQESFEYYAKNQGVRTKFLGRLDHESMMKQLRESDIAVNPIVAGSMGSVLNKVGDYAGAGLPVINTQESLEYRTLIARYEAGINCRTGDSTDVADAVQRLHDNKALRLRMGSGNFRMAQELFDRDNTYKQLALQILRLATDEKRDASL